MADLRVFTAVLVTELSQDDLIERLEALPGSTVAFCGPGSLVEGCDPPPAESPVEREVRLDEQRVVAEMERESVRGISPPDF